MPASYQHKSVSMIISSTMTQKVGAGSSSSIYGVRVLMHLLKVHWPGLWSSQGLTGITGASPKRAHTHECWQEFQSLVT